VLVFSRTTGFRHNSIPDAIVAVRALGDQSGFQVDATEDPSVFTDASLPGYSAVIFLLRRKMANWIRRATWFVNFNPNVCAPCRCQS